MRIYSVICSEDIEKQINTTLINKFENHRTEYIHIPAHRIMMPLYPKYCYLILEYIEGKTIKDIYGIGEPGSQLARTDFPKIKQIVKELLLGVEFLHRSGIIHRDIKPDIIINTEGKVKIIDFGISCIIEESSGAGIKSLTRTYTLPRLQFSNIPNAYIVYGKNNDIYACLLTVVYILAGMDRNIIYESNNGSGFTATQINPRIDPRILAIPIGQVETASEYDPHFIRKFLEGLEIMVPSGGRKKQNTRHKRATVNRLRKKTLRRVIRNKN
jgi:serine/threonine protein kinase